MKTFDGTKVASIEFAPPTDGESAGDESIRKLGKPLSATWTRKGDGTSGVIKLDYIVDASGRTGLISTRYLKNRSFNQGLKNVASWGYWKGGGVYGVGSFKEGSPYFEALKDASGWVWFIPLHNGTHSVGIVQNQDMATKKKREMNTTSSKDFYMRSLDLVPGIKDLLAKAELVSEIKSASDWSYSASCYACPNIRIAGDAGSFIDPFFSSGVHLALSGGLSSATTIAAAIRGDCDETTAAEWHNKKTAESYTRFLLVVSSALKQIRSQDEPVINDFDEKSFERAFDLFRPVIQGTVDADVKGKLTQAEISKTVEFCFRAFAHVSFEEKEALVTKLKQLGLDGDVNDETNKQSLEELEEKLTPEERQILTTLKGRRMVRPEDSLSIENFTLDSIDGLAPRLERGELGLKPAKKAEIKLTGYDALSFMNGEARASGKLAQSGAGDATTTNGGTTNGAESRPKTNGLSSNGTMNGTMYGTMNGTTSGTKTNTTSTEGATSLMAFNENLPSAPLEASTRHNLMASLHKAAEDLETPYDTMVRFVNAGRQVALVKVGIDLGIFQALASSSTPLCSKRLAKPAMADPALVGRILRYMAANNLIQETGPDHYIASRATHAFADPRIAGPMRFFHAVSNPSFQALPDFLKETGYQNFPSGSALQRGLGTNLGLYPWLKQRPDLLRDFQALMGLPKEGNDLDAVPFDDMPADHERPIFVDIGGNVGHQCSRVVAAHPALEGRVVVQDREETVESAAKVKGVQFMAHDFFKPQPIQGE